MRIEQVQVSGRCGVGARQLKARCKGAPWMDTGASNTSSHPLPPAGCPCAPHAVAALHKAQVRPGEVDPKESEGDHPHSSPQHQRAAHHRQSIQAGQVLQQGGAGKGRQWRMGAGLAGNGRCRHRTNSPAWGCPPHANTQCPRRPILPLPALPSLAAPLTLARNLSAPPSSATSLSGISCFTATSSAATPASKPPMGRKRTSPA